MLCMHQELLQIWDRIIFYPSFYFIVQSICNKFRGVIWTVHIFSKRLYTNFLLH